jgi:hypothetical protein
VISPPAYAVTNPTMSRLGKGPHPGDIDDVHAHHLLVIWSRRLCRATDGMTEAVFLYRSHVRHRSPRSVWSS